MSNDTFDVFHQRCIWKIVRMSWQNEELTRRAGMQALSEIVRSRETSWSCAEVARRQNCNCILELVVRDLGWAVCSLARLANIADVLHPCLYLSLPYSGLQELHRLPIAERIYYKQCLVYTMFVGHILVIPVSRPPCKLDDLTSVWRQIHGRLRNHHHFVKFVLGIGWGLMLNERVRVK